jgi:hypothetical protein
MEGEGEGEKEGKGEGGGKRVFFLLNIGLIMYIICLWGSTCR